MEFNIPPINTQQQLLDNINRMKDFIINYLIERNFDLQLACKASAILEMDQLLDEQSFVFGCDPDFSCYTEKQNPTPALLNPYLRSAGCHFHLGYANPSVAKGIELIKYMDMFLGIPSILMDTDIDRRNLYGKAGSYRFQKWGVEYRVLSSYFISSNETLTSCYNQIEKAINAFENQMALVPKEEVLEVINNNNTNLANHLINKFNIL